MSANESETEDWQHRDIAMADLEHRLSSAETELRETAGELERIREQSDSWCRAHRVWQQWVTQLLRKLGLQPEGGEHGDGPARGIIESRLTEANALLDSAVELMGHICRMLESDGRYPSTVKKLRENIEQLSRAPAQPAAPTPLPGGEDVDVSDWRPMPKPAAPEPSVSPEYDLGPGMREAHQRMRAESAEAQLAAVHHNGLYVEGYDFAVVVPLAVVRAVLPSPGAGEYRNCSLCVGALKPSPSPDAGEKT
jgi:hypothetical protein